MTKIEIYRERLPMHPMLGRHVMFDSRSKMFAVQPKATPITSVRHAQHIDILDQGQVGSCTGNASTSCAYHEPFFSPKMPNWHYAPNEAGALDWYRANTANDDYPGTYEPDDTGSDGLTCSKVAVQAGVASGYRAALDLDSSLEALMSAPGVTGLPWFNSMFQAGSGGLLTVDVSSGLAGGHEIVVDEVVAANEPGNGTGQLLVGGNNSWGSSWGRSGRWYLKASDWWMLRQQQGDVYFWTPAADPAPSPSPSVDPSTAADADLWDATAEFRSRPHVGVNHEAADALKAWGALKEFA